jgi:hypothetical protein
MFEQDLGKTKDKDNKTLIIIAVVFCFLLSVTGVLLYKSFLSHPKTPPPPGLAGALKAGNTDYDSYLKQVVITNQEAFYSANALGGNVITAKGRIQNLGNRMLKGLEIRLVAYDMENKVLAQRLVAVVPNFSSQLLANGTLPVEIPMGNAPDEAFVKEIKLEVTGMIF